ncbi:MAG: hypothetical protein HY865_15655 [Chloroflexi bacterium]|nr:hypothetical protein [Chloroflexota bacterium]
MNQFVNSALASIKQGDKNKAIELLKQAIASSQNDVDAWLVLSALMDHPERKRQCLNRVLTLEPANRIAREEMLKLDRAAMGNAMAAQPSHPVQEKSVQVSSPQVEPVQAQQPALNTRVDFGAESSNPQPRPMSKPAVSQQRFSKPLVFRYPILILLATYAFAVLFFIFNIFAIADVTLFLTVCGINLVFLISIWMVSAKVEISEEGISSSRMFGVVYSQVKWNDIESAKPAAQGLNLVARDGSSVKITSQVSGYSSVIKILRERRPDLFDITPSVRAGSGDEGFIELKTTFSGEKVFKKGFLGRFGSYIITIPFFFVCIWTIFADSENMIAASIGAVVTFFLILSPLFDVFELTVTGNKIKLVSMFDEKELTARNIREVKMKSVRSRSVVHHFPALVTDKGKEYTLKGFSEGNEMLYGFLLNWWNAHQNQ